MQETIGEIVRKMETEYVRGNVTISEYVNFDMYFTINKTEAYLNSVHITGRYDSKGREKPFPNIVIAAANIWDRATDIDRKNINLKAVKAKDTIDIFLLERLIHNWMNKADFGSFLNEWGRVLSRYGSAVVKFIEKDGELIILVIPWNRLIVDPIDFENNPKIEVLELTESQLRQKKGYNKEMVDNLITAKRNRETLRGQRKDNKSNYYKLYEIHGLLPLSLLTKKDSDKETIEQQMHVISYVSSKNKGEYDDFTLYSGKEKDDPYMITHLIKEDGRTLSKGSVELLFEPQKMQNHMAKSIKDQLDMAGKLVLQTSDKNLAGKNSSTLDTGDIIIHAINEPLLPVGNNSHDVSAQQNFASYFKSLGDQTVGASESMLGINPKSGTAWRTTEALLQESHSFFEKMTENKGLQLEQMFRNRIVPFHLKKMDTAEEISSILDSNSIEWVDSRFIKNYTASENNRIISDKILSGQAVSAEEQAQLVETIQGGTKEALKEQGSQRFFRPSEIKTKTWKKQLKDIEWEMDFDVTGESKDYQASLATLNTALQVIIQPGYGENKQAQMVVEQILRLTGHLSPLQISSIRSAPAGPPEALLANQNTNAVV